ncbi:MAG: choice-of-anchor B family protein [Aurantibacter sp.]
MKKLLLPLLLIFLFAGCSSDNSPIPPPVQVDPNDPNPDPDPDPNPNDPDSVAGSAIVQTGLVPCEGGMANGFPCNGYDLLGNVTLGNFAASGGNDCWGWTDPDTGNEYALMGLDNGTAFVDITDIDNLKYLGKLPTATDPSGWRDIKVYQNHAFIVSEAVNHGMQVFDLTRLRDAGDTPVAFDADARYTGFGNAHNIVINEDTGFAYPVGSGTFGGGAHFINIQDPKNPVAAGGHGANGYTHDAQVITYNGPDADYSGKEIYIGSNENQVAIVDVTDKSSPQEISTISYSNLSYTHQGWFTEDHKYFIVGDELDEADFGFNSRTLIFDFTDLDNPVLHTTYNGPTSAIDHNGYVLGNQFFLANYTAGMRVIDITGIDGETIVEEGFFDSHPATNVAAFNGVWSVYPYFPSGKVILSDINRGLFVIQKSN